MFYRLVLANRLRLGGRAAFQREDDFANLDLLTFFTLISRTIPLTVEGTSTTALSVSSSMTGWPSETVVPGEIIKRTRSPESMFSPNSGSLNSLAVARDGVGLWLGAPVEALAVAAGFAWVAEN